MAEKKNHTNMTNQNNTANKQGAGTQYHNEHASNVPDYGGNSMERIAEETWDIDSNGTN